MTDINVDVETQAQQLVARGREVLLERTRAAYSSAAAAQADLITLDEARIETLVQAAADRADGLQWRRALASVAAEEFGIDATDALSHPAVVRAQMLVGAPSYDQSLAELMARPVPPAIQTPVPAHSYSASAPGRPESEPTSDPGVAETSEPAAASAESTPQAELASEELETVEADDVVLELLPEPDPVEYETELDPAAFETQAYDIEASFIEEPSPTEEHHPAGVGAAIAAASVADSVPDPVAADGTTEPDQPAAMPDPAPLDEHPQDEHPQDEHPVDGHPQDAHPEDEEENIEVSFPAVHLGGVANLPTKREGLSVRLSADGLDIMEGPREIIGRLVWSEIEALEVPHLRVRRRQKTARARLVVRTPHGDASFEVPEVAADELRDRVEPLMRLYGER